MVAARSRRSAGILLHRRVGGVLQVLLGHPGGPFWARRDDGAWSIPKGEYADDEDAWTAARREFTEETGLAVPVGPPIALTPVRQSGGKTVTAFAVRGDPDLSGFTSNQVELEWPRGSGRVLRFPELDRIDWFDVDAACAKVLTGQRPLLDELVGRLAER